MNHLSEERILQLFLDARGLQPEEADHLEVCLVCQEKQARYAALLQDLAIARKSQPTPQALARYYQLFHEIPRQTLAHRVEQALQRLVLALGFDSRLQPGLGVRRAIENLGYRLLYTSEQADIELYVESTGDTRRIEGEILIDKESGLEGPFWVELRAAREGEAEADRHQNARATTPLAVTVSRPDGYFRIQNVLPGRYRLALIPTEGDTMLSWIEVENLEIT